MDFLKKFATTAEYEAFGGDWHDEYELLIDSLEWYTPSAEEAALGLMVCPVKETSVKPHEFIEGIVIKLEREVLPTDWLFIVSWQYSEYYDGWEQDRRTYGTIGELTNYQDDLFLHVGTNMYKLPSIFFELDPYNMWDDARIAVVVVPNECVSDGKIVSASTLTQKLLMTVKRNNILVPHIGLTADDEMVHYNPVFKGESVIFPEWDYSTFPKVWKMGEFYPELGRFLKEIRTLNSEKGNDLISLGFTSVTNEQNNRLSTTPTFSYYDSNMEFIVLDASCEKFTLYLKKSRFISPSNDRSMLFETVGFNEYAAYNGYLGIDYETGECFSAMPS